MMIKLAILCFLITYVAGILNGNTAKPGEFPYIVSIRYFGVHICGGSILDETRILTAAHCVLKPRETLGNLSIQYGLFDISTNENVIPVVGSQNYEDYPFNDYYVHDIAVMTISSSIKFGKNAQKVILPDHNDRVPYGQWGTLAGWGLNKNGGSPQNDLNLVDILIYPDCSKDLGAAINYDYQFCSGVPEEDKGQCKGDDGGPLIVNGTQVGILSWNATPCTIKGYPGVFTRVSRYIIWINCILNHNC